MVTWHHINWLYSISGFFVGALVGLTGVGGGSLMTPLLVLLFGVAPATAVGTDLLYAAITKSGGMLVHSLHRTVEWRIVGRLAAGSVPATAATILTLDRFGIPNHPASHDLISIVLGVALIMTALSLVFRRRLLATLAPRMERLSARGKLALTVALGAFLGVFVSISSVGAGAIGVTVLLLIYPALPTVRIVGSDIAHAVPLTLVAGAGHWYLGSVDFAMLLSLTIGSLPGIMIASHLAGRVPEPILRPLLAATLAIVGFRLAI